MSAPSEPTPPHDIGQGLPGDPPEGWEQMGESRLPGLGILSMMSPQSLATLEGYGEFVTARIGQDIIVEGQMQDRFYVVVDGLLQIYKMIDGQEFTLAHAESGECLGESALLEPAPAVASARVLRDAVLWGMNAEALRDYLSAHAGGGGALLMGMAQCLTKRLRSANQQIMEHCNKPTYKAAPGAVQAIHAPTQSLKKGLFGGLFGGASNTDKKVKLRKEIKI